MHDAPHVPPAADLDGLPSDEPFLGRPEGESLLHAALREDAQNEEAQLKAGDAAWQALEDDVADALRTLDAASGSGAATETSVPARVRMAALGAFQASLRESGLEASGFEAVGPSGPVSGVEQATAVEGASAVRVLRAQEAPGMPWFVRGVAALLVVGFAVAVIALSGVLREGALGDRGDEAHATPGLHVESMAHFGTAADAAGTTPAPDAIRTRRAALLPVGHVVAPTSGQVVAFGLGHRTHVVVGDGGRLRVAAGHQVDPALLNAAVEALTGMEAFQGTAGGGMDLAALLRLESGEALLDAGAGRPVLLAVGDAGLLVLWRGAAHVAIDDGVPAVALRAESRAHFHHARGEGAVARVDLEGGTRAVLHPTGVKRERLGDRASGDRAPGGGSGDAAAGATSVFRDLEVFGGALLAQEQVTLRRVSAKLWRRLGGAAHDARRQGARFHLRLRSGEHEPVRLAFLPHDSLYGATMLRIDLRAPAGTRVGLRGHPTPAAGAPALVVDEVLTTDTRSQEPGSAPIVLRLPSDWYTRLGGGELVLVFTAPEGTASIQEAVFAEVAFRADSALTPR